MPGTEPFLTALVLAAGGSPRLRRPPQLRPYRGQTALHAAISTARLCGARQVVVVLGPTADEVRRRVDLRRCDVVLCAEGRSPIAAGIAAVDARCDVLVVLPGDRPGIREQTIRDLLEGRGDAPLAAAHYCDGRGYPIAFGRAAFGGLTALGSEREVWRLLDDHGRDVDVHGQAPHAADTFAEYEAVFSS